MENTSIKKEDNSTTENNCLIAEFMGFDVYDDELFGNTIRVFSVKTDDTVERALKRHHVNQLKYTSSWDWLMPVVKRIHNLQPQAFEVDLSAGPLSPLAELKIIDSIEAVYKAVVEFIKWYNTQHENKKV